MWMILNRGGKLNGFFLEGALNSPNVKELWIRGVFQVKLSINIPKWCDN